MRAAVGGGSGSSMALGALRRGLARFGYDISPAVLIELAKSVALGGAKGRRMAARRGDARPPRALSFAQFQQLVSRAPRRGGSAGGGAASRPMDETARFLRGESGTSSARYGGGTGSGGAYDARPSSAGALARGGGGAATGTDAYGRPQTAIPSTRRDAAAAARVGGGGPGQQLSTHTRRMAAAAAARRRREAPTGGYSAAAAVPGAMAAPAPVAPGVGGGASRGPGGAGAPAGHELLVRIGKELSRQSHRFHDVYKKMKTHGQLGVDSDDLAWGLEREGVRVSEAESEALVEAFDRSGDGALSYGDFLHLVNTASDAAGE